MLVSQTRPLVSSCVLRELQPKICAKQPSFATISLCNYNMAQSSADMDPAAPFRRSRYDVVATPSVIQVKPPNRLPRVKPQVLLEDGWALYFADEAGIVTPAPTHLHIHNSVDGSDVGVPIHLFGCLLKGMLELKKYYK